MGGWHECDAQCALLHSALFSKIASIVRQSRTTVLPKSIRTDICFNIETVGESSPPPLPNPAREGWGLCVLELQVLLDTRRVNEDRTGASNADRRAKLLVESPRLGTLVEVEKDVYQRSSQSAGILIETWRVEFEPSEVGPRRAAVTLAEFTKQVTMAVRAIYSLTRLLPAHKLSKSLRKPRQAALSGSQTVPIISETSALHLYVLDCHSSSGEEGPAMVRLDESILQEGAFEPISHVRLAPLQSPHGKIRIDVLYRRHCRFELEHVLTSVCKTASRHSSFENVELEAGLSSSMLAKTPANVAANEQELRFGISLGEKPAIFSAIAAATVPATISSSSPLSATTRSKSLHNVNLPLGESIKPASFSRRTSSPTIPSHRRTGSSIVEDSLLTKFMNSCENRPPLQKIPMVDLPAPSALRARYESVQSWLKEEIRIVDSRSRLVFSPLLESQKDEEQTVHVEPQDDDTSPIIFTFQT